MTYIPTAKDRPYPAHARIIPTYNQERETSAYLCSLVTRALRAERQARRMNTAKHTYPAPRYRITLERCAQRFSAFSDLPYERKGRHAA